MTWRVGVGTGVDVVEAGTLVAVVVVVSVTAAVTADDVGATVLVVDVAAGSVEPTSPAAVSVDRPPSSRRSRKAPPAPARIATSAATATLRLPVLGLRAGPAIPGGKPLASHPGSGRGDTASSMRMSTSRRIQSGGGRNGIDAMACNRPRSTVRRPRQRSHRRACRSTRAPTAGVNRPSHPSRTSARRGQESGSPALSARLRSMAPTDVSARPRSRAARSAAVFERTPSTTPRSSASSWWRRWRCRMARSGSDSALEGSQTTRRGSSPPTSPSSPPAGAGSVGPEAEAAELEPPGSAPLGPVAPAPDCAGPEAAGPGALGPAPAGPD